MIFTKLTKEEQLTIMANVAEAKGIVDNAVEKDYWVSMVLRAIFLYRMQQPLFSREEQALAKVGD